MEIPKVRATRSTSPERGESAKRFPFWLTAFIAIVAAIIPGWIAFAAGDDVLYIDDKGNVGIGTSQPETALDVKGTVRAEILKGDGSSIVVKGVPLESRVKQLLDKIAALEAKQAALEARQYTVSASLAKWGDQKKVSYGDGAHAWTYTQATCPEGYYAVGIRVRYRGTCLSKCNRDGGIIGDIELDCRKLGVP